MCSRCREALLLLTVLASLAACAGEGKAKPARELRVCADPNNLPFSNRRLEGFENRIAELVAREMGAAVRYTWWPQRRGFIRHTLDTGACDVVMGIPSSFELALDQQLAGLLMWVPSGVFFILLGLALFAAWLGESERRVAFTESERLWKAAAGGGDGA